MCPVMPWLSSSTCQADAIFASALQRSDEPSTGQVRRAVAAAIGAFGYAGLRPRDRDLLSARYLHDLCIGDIAADLNVSAGTIKSRLAAARAALRRNLQSGNGAHPAGGRGLRGSRASPPAAATGSPCAATARPPSGVLRPQAGELRG
jgi:hypothetical protein